MILSFLSVAIVPGVAALIGFLAESPTTEFRPSVEPEASII